MISRPDDPRHGTSNGYRNHGCRCAACRQANTDDLRDWRRRRGIRPMESYQAARKAISAVRDDHGTESMYAHGCRCDACRNAMSAARRRRRAAQVAA